MTKLIFYLVLAVLPAVSAAQLRLMRDSFRDLTKVQPASCDAARRVCAYTDTDSVLIAEKSTGRPLRRIFAPAQLEPPIVLVSHDGKQVALGCRMMACFTVFADWDIVSGRPIYSRPMAFAMQSSTVAAMAFTADDKLLAVKFTSGYAEVWNTADWHIVAAGDEVSSLAGKFQFQRNQEPSGSSPGIDGLTDRDLSVSDFELTNDDRLLLPGLPGRVFDLRSGTLATIASPSPDSMMDSYDVSNTVVTGIWDWTTAQLVDAKTLQKIDDKKWTTYRAMAVSPDGTRIALKRGTRIAVISRSDGAEKLIETGGNFETLKFSADGNTIIASGENTGFQAYTVATGAAVWLPKLDGKQDLVSDGLHYAASVTYAKYVRVFDLKQQRAICEIPLEANRAAKFSADEKLLAVGMSTGGIAVIDLARRQRISVVSGFPGEIVNRIRFTADGRKLVASNQDGLIRVWDLASGKELLTLLLQKMNWAAFTPSGFYDGAEEELNHFYWVRDLGTEPLRSEAAEHRVRGLVAKVWGGASPIADAFATASGMSSPDVPTVQLETAPSKADKDGQITLAVRVRGDLPGLSVFGVRNGVPIAFSAASQVGQFKAQLKLTEGADHLVVWAQDALGRVTNEAVLDRDFNNVAAPKPEIVPKRTVSDMVQVAFSRDGSLLATSAGNQVVLWDVRTRRQLRTLTGPSSPLGSIAFGNDDLVVASVQNRGASVWSAQTGEEVCRLGMFSQLGFPPIAISPDGTLIAIGDAGMVRVFSPTDCQEITSLDAGQMPPAWITDSIIVQDRKTPNTIHTVNLKTGQSESIDCASPPASVTPLPDGRLMVLLKTGQIAIEKNGSLQPFLLPAGGGDKAKLLGTSSSGSLFLDMGKKEFLFDASLSNVVHTFSDGYLNSAALSANGKWLAVVDTSSELKVYSLPSAERAEIAVQPGYGAVTQLAFSPDGEVLASGRGKAPFATVGLYPLPGSFRLQFWDVATGSVMHTFEPIGGDSNLNWLLTSDLKSIGDVAAKLELAPFSLETNRGQDGRLSIESSEIDKDHVTTAVLPQPEPQMGLLALQGWRLSGNAKTVAIAGRNPGEIEVVDVGTNSRISAFHAHPGEVLEAAMSPDGSSLLTWGDGGSRIGEGEVHMWKRDGTPLWKVGGTSMNPQVLAISRTNKLAAISGDGSIRILNGATGARLVSATISEIPTVMTFSPDDRRLAIGTDDGVIEIYDVATGRELVTLASETDGDLAYTPGANYSGTLTRSTQLSFRLGEHVYPLRQFDLYFDRPDLIIEAMAPELKDVIAAYQVAYAKRLELAHATFPSKPDFTSLPDVRIAPPTNASVETRDVSLKVSATADKDATLKSLEVQVNGVLDRRVDVTGEKTVETDIPLVLSSGTNNIEVTAMDALGRRSLTESVSIENHANSQKTLYLVPVGISKYADANQQLKFAAKDAMDLAEYFRKTKDSNKEYDRVEIVGPLTDGTATHDEILKVRNILAKADVDDTVVVFFAGHGVLDKNFDFYFAPSDMKFSAPAANGLTISQMEALVSGSKSRKRLLMIDACHSGELDTKGIISKAKDVNGADLPGATRGVDLLMDAKSVNAFDLEHALFADLRENTGTQIISAARGQEVAYELNSIANGLFTRSVLNGLENSHADANADGHVSVSELLEFVSAQVQALSHGQQTPTQRQANLEADFLVQ